ncbi:transposase, partial [Sporolactobacillus inulinus CASD]
MYSNVDKLKAVQLFHQYDRAWAQVLRELGYPSRSALKLWVRQYESDAHAFDERSRGKYTDSQRKEAVDYYFEHGRSSVRAVRILGFPSRTLLDIWVREDSRYTEHKITVAPDRVKHPIKPRVVKSNTTAMQVAKLKQKAPCDAVSRVAPRNLTSLNHEELLKRAQELELQNDILL